MSMSKLASRVGVIAGIGCTIHCFFEYICDFVVCSGEILIHEIASPASSRIFSGESMQPTLYSDNILICNKIAKRFSSYKRNDIVIATHPSQPTNLICKRLIAIPGDVVLMSSIDSDDKDTKTINIKQGSCWLEGDNRLNSTDSRNYGQIPIGLIKSKVLARIYPFSDFRVF